MNRIEEGVFSAPLPSPQTEKFTTRGERMLVHLTCAMCGADFTVPQYRIDSNKRHGISTPKCCSRECDYKSRCPNRPTMSQLEQWYVVEGLSSIEIAKRCGVARTSVKKWLHLAGIAVRPTGCGLANQRRPLPSRDDLYRMVHFEHLGYRDIAKRYGVTLNAVHQWIAKYEIERPTVWQTRRRGAIPVLPTEEELRALYEAGKSLTVIADMFGVSHTSIRPLCKKYGIDVREGGWKGGIRFECQDGHQVRSTYEQRVDDWLSKHNIPHEYEPRLPFDQLSRADFLANGWYIEVWGVQNSRTYQIRRRKKLAAYREYGLPLIHFTADAFATRRNSWARLLTRCLVAPHPQVLNQSPEQLCLPLTPE